MKDSGTSDFMGWDVLEKGSLAKTPAAAGGCKEAQRFRLHNKPKKPLRLGGLGALACCLW